MQAGRSTNRFHDKRLPDQLRTYRRENRLGWADLAALCGLSTSGIWKIAQGKARATELTADQIRKALGLREEQPVNEVVPNGL